MSRLLVTAVLVLAGVGGAVPDAHALGPFCFQLTPSPNVVVWFVDTAGNQFFGSGRDLAQNAGQSVAGFVSGNTAFVSFVTAAGPGSTSIPYVGSAEINVNTGSGPGRYTNLRPEGASTGTFTLVPVACPANALVQRAPDPGRFPGVPVGAASAPEPPAARDATAGLLAEHRAR